MGLDIKTLFVADVAVLLISSAVSLYFLRKDRGGDWLLWWATGTAMTGVAMLAIGVSGPVPGPAIGIPAATMLVAGFVTVWQSMRRLNDRPAVKGWAIFLVSAFVTVLSAAVILGADLHQRTALLMVAMALSATACAWEVRFGAPTPSPNHLPLAGIFLLMGAMLALSAVLTALREHVPVATFGDLLGEILPPINSIGILCVCFYVMLIVNERARSRYRKLASTDDLTGLPNRRFFIEEASRLSRGVNPTGMRACVLMMDLDHFSEVNRRYGHAGGDEALKAFADVLRQGLRATDIVARYGGEEFCAFLLGTEMAEAIGIAEKLREAIAGLPINLNEGQPLRITVSIGVAPLGDEELATAVNSADAALYLAKSQGRNQVVAAQGDTVKPVNAGRSKLRIVR
jgi:diguanylate cyclase (GGDEF)-like protein